MAPPRQTDPNYMDADSDSDLSLLGDDEARIRGKGKGKATDKRKKDKGKGKAKEVCPFHSAFNIPIDPIPPASLYMGGVIYPFMGYGARG
jgi:hypothetical protein